MSYLKVTPLQMKMVKLISKGFYFLFKLYLMTDIMKSIFSVTKVFFKYESMKVSKLQNSLRHFLLFKKTVMRKL